MITSVQDEVESFQTLMSVDLLCFFSVFHCLNGNGIGFVTCVVIFGYTMFFRLLISLTQSPCFFVFFFKSCDYGLSDNSSFHKSTTAFDLDVLLEY